MVSIAQSQLPTAARFVRRSIEIGGAPISAHGAETFVVPHGAAIIDCAVITRQGDPHGRRVGDERGGHDRSVGLDRIVGAGRTLASRHSRLK